MTWSIILMAVSALICLFVPTVVAIIFIKKRGAKWRSFLIGAAVFTVFQLLTRIPLLQVLQTTAWFTAFTIMQPVLYALLLAFTAGLFEEVGRFAGIQLLRKPGLVDWDNAFVFGLGHGGMEAFALAGVNYAATLAQILTGHASGGVLSAVMSAAPWDLLAGGVERMLAVAMHIGFTMLVFYAVRQKNLWWLVLAVFVHMAVDTVAVMIGMGYIPVGTWGSEGILALLTVPLVLVTVRFKKLLGKQTQHIEGGVIDEKGI